MFSCDFVFRVFIQKLFLVFLLFTLVRVSDTLSSDFEPGGKPETKLMNPDAEAIIGAIVNIRERGSGLFRCGQRTVEGSVIADALQWTVDELNRNIWSGSSANVSFGLHIMDSCGRMRTAESQLLEFLPELKSTNENFVESGPFKFCVVDAVGLNHEEDIYKSLEDISVPVIETDININSPQVLTNAILLFIQELQWDRVVVVYGDSKLSSSTFKQFTKLLRKFDICIPWVVNFDEVNKEELQMILKSEIPILPLLSEEEQSLFLQSLQDITKPKNTIPILFSGFLSRQQLKMLSSNNFQIFSVLTYPNRDDGFERFFSENQIASENKEEDDLDVVLKTSIIRKVKQIGKKLSEALRRAIETVCSEKERLCSTLLSLEGKNVISELLMNMDWTESRQSYQLVEYQLQTSSERSHLQKLMIYKGHKNLEIFEDIKPFPNSDCDEENDSRLECRCLEVKSVRSGSGRNINEWGNTKKKNSTNSIERIGHLTVPEVERVDKVLPKPMIYATLNDPVNVTLACLTLLGALLTLIIAQYFATFAALPNGGLTTGTSVIGYVILIGLFLLFSTNLSFLLTPLVSTCAIRRFGISFSYAVVFSGLLIKIWSTFRQVVSEKSKSSKPATLVFYSGAFSLLQGLLSSLWLILKPPATEYTEGKWTCYPPGGLDSHLILSMIYPLAVLLVTIILAIRTCSKNNSDEARWILISCSLVAIIISCWGVAIGTGVWQTYRTSCTNLAVGTILLLCLYIPKIKKHLKLKKTLKSQANVPPITVDVNKECSVFTTSHPFPVVLGYNPVPPAIPTEETIEPNLSFLNQAYSPDDTSESVSTPFDIDSSSYSELDHEPYTFSTFLEDPKVPTLKEDITAEDPTQVVPSTLYPLEMFNTEPIAITSDHCQPGSNEFTPPHRATSQLYLCPEPEWVP